MGIGLSKVVKLAVLIVLLAPLIVMSSPLPDTYYPYIIGKALYVRSLAQVAFVLWIILAFWYPNYRIPRSWLLSIFGLYILVALLSTILGVSPQRSMWSTYERMQGWIDLAHWFALTVVMVSIFRSFSDWRFVLQFNLLINLVMCVLGLFEIMGIQVVSFYPTDDRLQISLGNATFVGAYMLVNLFIAVAFISHSFCKTEKKTNLVSRNVQRARRRSRNNPNKPGVLSRFIDQTLLFRIFWFAVIFLDIVMIVRSGTRGAVVGLISGLVVFAFIYLVWGKLRKIRILSIVLLGGILVTVSIFVVVRDVDWFRDMTKSSAMITRLANIGPNDFSTMGRVNSFIIGFNGFKDRPLFGWGPENYSLAYDRHLTAKVSAGSHESFDQAHNKVVEELVTKGIFGVGAYLSIWVAMLVVVIRRVKYQAPDIQIFTIFIACAASTYFVQNMFLFDTPGTVGQFYLLLGFVAFLESYRRQPQNALETGKITESELPKWAQRYAFLNTDIAKRLALMLGILVISLGIHIFIYGPYDGSRSVIVALALEPNPTENRTWMERIEYFNRAVNASPELANYPRRYMFNTLSLYWNQLNNEEVVATLDIVAREGPKAINSEPQEWRNQLSLANLYQTASRHDRKYLELSQDFLNQAANLAPERTEIKEVQIRQFVIEGETEKAIQYIDDYLETNAEYFTPDSRVYKTFQNLRLKVEEIIEAIENYSSEGSE